MKDKLPAMTRPPHDDSWARLCADVLGRAGVWMLWCEEEFDFFLVRCEFALERIYLRLQLQVLRFQTLLLRLQLRKLRVELGYCYLLIDGERGPFKRIKYLAHAWFAPNVPSNRRAPDDGK